MLGAQQLGTVSPGQLSSVQPGQLITAPGVYTQQEGGIGDMLSSIMPLVMMMMVMMMIMPMMKGMSDAFK